MKTLLAVILFLLGCSEGNCQLLAVSDTINDIKYKSYSIYTLEWSTRKNDRHESFDEAAYQNFSDLVMQKQQVGEDIYYILTYWRKEQIKWSREGHRLFVAKEDRHKPSSWYQMLEYGVYLAFNEKQYAKLKECLAKKKGKIYTFKTSLNGNFYNRKAPIELEFKRSYKINMTFMVSCDSTCVRFRLPDEGVAPGPRKKIFKKNHFICDIPTFSKILID